VLTTQISLSSYFLSFSIASENDRGTNVARIAQIAQKGQFNQIASNPEWLPQKGAEGLPSKQSRGAARERRSVPDVASVTSGG
jgi:hypothetical protein